MSEELATQAQLTRRYGIKDNTLAMWEKRYEDFPTPKQYEEHRRLKRPYWSVSEMDQWVRDHREKQIAKLPTVPSETEQSDPLKVIQLIIAALRSDPETHTDGECLEAVAEIIETNGYGTVYQ